MILATVESLSEQFGRRLTFTTIGIGDSTPDFLLDVAQIFSATSTWGGNIYSYAQMDGASNSYHGKFGIESVIYNNTTGSGYDEVRAFDAFASAADDVAGVADDVAGHLQER